MTLKANEKKVEVNAFVEDMAASGGYWLACMGKNIYIRKVNLNFIGDV